MLILAEIGVITEQGDLGLGYNPLSQEEQRLVEEAAKNGKENEDKKKMENVFETKNNWIASAIT